MNTSPEAVLEFWFEECTPEQWWTKDTAFDEMVAQRFGPLHASAAAAELWRWRGSAQARLAEIIVLDQFSRNIYRGEGRAFACDSLALGLAQQAVSGGHDRSLDVQQRMLLYMPYMHSESAAIHEEALRVFAQPGMEQMLDYERRHQAIIDRFGRYPHRNQALGRESSPAELLFLQEPGAGF